MLSVEKRTGVKHYLHLHLHYATDYDSDFDFDYYYLYLASLDSSWERALTANKVPYFIEYV